MTRRTKCVIELQCQSNKGHSVKCHEETLVGHGVSILICGHYHNQPCGIKYHHDLRAQRSSS